MLSHRYSRRQDLARTATPPTLNMMTFIRVANLTSNACEEQRETRAAPNEKVRQMVMRATNSLCLLLAILCTTKIYIHAFVVHSGACHVTSGSAGLLPTAGVGRHATSACLSGTTARGQGSFVGPPLIQSALAGGRRAVRRSRSNAGRR